MALLGAAGLGYYLWETRDQWPELRSDAKWEEAAVLAAADPRARDFIRIGIDYDAEGPYFDYAELTYQTRGKVRLDDDGLPTVQYGEEFYYNPVTLGQFTLAAHAKYLGGGDVGALIKGANKLIAIQSEDGAFRYPFPYRHYTQDAPWEPGWTSGMGQGVALSALARAYAVTSDEQYRIAGDKSLDFLNVPFPEGPRSTLGVLHPSLSGYVFFLEYPTKPNVLTLNGFMFTLLGLYDWAEVTDSRLAQERFDQGVSTLRHILPYYDLGAISSYDLSHLILPERDPHLSPRYHSIHVEQLKALFSITGDVVLHEYAAKWASYGIGGAY